MTQAEYINRFNQILAEAKIEAEAEGDILTDEDMVRLEKSLMNICKSARQVFEKGEHLKI